METAGAIRRAIDSEGEGDDADGADTLPGADYAAIDAVLPDPRPRSNEPKSPARLRPIR